VTWGSMQRCRIVWSECRCFRGLIRVRKRERTDGSWRPGVFRRPREVRMCLPTVHILGNREDDNVVIGCSFVSGSIGSRGLASAVHMEGKVAGRRHDSTVDVSKRSYNAMATCTGLTFRFELDSTLPIRAWFAQNEADDSARCAIIDTAAIVTRKRRADEHASFEARVH